MTAAIIMCYGRMLVEYLFWSNGDRDTRKGILDKA